MMLLSGLNFFRKLLHDSDVLSGLFLKHSLETIALVHDGSKHQNRLPHVLVLQNKLKSLRLFAELGGNINATRIDGNTPLHVAVWSEKKDAFELLKELGANLHIKNNYEETPSDLLHKKSNVDNIIFLDLELTCLPCNGIPKILECAVVITDGKLEELERKEWVIHFEKNELDSLSPWHQKFFADTANGGNGLFQACIDSNVTYELFESEILELLQRRCVKKANPLGGFSVHCDREIMFQCARPIYDFVSHQVVDVSTLLSLCKRWNPVLISELESTNALNDRQKMHRAMFDVEDSIRTLKWCRQNLFVHAQPRDNSL